MKHRTDRRRVRQLEREAESGLRQVAGVAAVDVCQRKKTWPTKALAKESAAIVMRTFKKRAYPYECPECRRWHLTSLPPEEFRARQRETTP